MDSTLKPVSSVSSDSVNLERELEISRQEEQAHLSEQFERNRLGRRIVFILFIMATIVTLGVLLMTKGK